MPRYRGQVRQAGHGRAEPPGHITAYLVPAVPTALSPQACDLRSPGCTQGNVPPSPGKVTGRVPEKRCLPATPHPKASLSPSLKPLGLDGGHRLCFQKLMPQDFPGGPVATSLGSQRWERGAVPGQGTRPRLLQLRAGAAKEKELVLCLHRPPHRPRDHSPNLGGGNGEKR